MMTRDEAGAIFADEVMSRFPDWEPTSRETEDWTAWIRPLDRAAVAYAVREMALDAHYKKPSPARRFIQLAREHFEARAPQRSGYMGNFVVRSQGDTGKPVGGRYAFSGLCSKDDPCLKCRFLAHTRRLVSLYAMTVPAEET